MKTFLLGCMMLLAESEPPIDFFDHGEYIAPEPCDMLCNQLLNERRQMERSIQMDWNKGVSPPDSFFDGGKPPLPEGPAVGEAGSS